MSRRALARLDMFGHVNIDTWGQIDRFDYCEAIDFDRLLKTWSVFDESSDTGVFRGAKSNGGVRSFKKSVFGVESMDSIRPQNRNSTLLRSDRFWSTFWIFVDFWRNFGYGGFRGRWIECRCSFVLKIDIWGRIDRFDHCGRSDRFWFACRNLVNFWRNLGYGGFRGCWIEWWCYFFFKINICGRIELRECWGHFSPNDEYINVRLQKLGTWTYRPCGYFSIMILLIFYFHVSTFYVSFCFQGWMTR